MPIRILCIGDIVGKPGRQAVAELLPPLIEKEKLDFVVANAENAAGGSGLTPQLFEKILRCGVDVCTLGDHTYRKRDIYPTLESSDRLIRPGNYPAEAVGKGYTVQRSRSGVSVAVLQVMGRVYMNPLDDPFRTIDRMLEAIPRDIKVRVVDFHADASSEKIAMGWHLDGRVSIDFGTHTHTPTADARILPNGTAFISDVGMTGPYESVLGRKKDAVLKHFITGMNFPFDVAIGDPRLCGIIASVDEQTGRALDIRRCELAATPDDSGEDSEENKSGHRNGGI
jgi:2',3'-cyclic-nucleotide 2'-phosphodiesterase